MNTFWGDTHTNIHENQMEHVAEIFEEARRQLDFFMVAYYPAEYYTLPGGLRVESVGMRPEFARSWERIKEMVRKFHSPGEFVTFAGYEWSGDRRRWGDVNVFYFDDDGELDLSDSLPELYEHLRARKALVIPHHTAYLPHERGKDWTCHDANLSPVTEIYSTHGSSEGIRAPYPLFRNASMGPRVSGGTAIDGLNRGLRLGLIASGDSHYGFPGVWGTGLVAAQAEELTREAIWDAFFKRRVYGVTGDRILLEFAIGDCPMGGETEARGALSILARVTGSDALDRIELIRDGRVIATHCHVDTWPEMPEKEPLRFKLRMECGWGPKTGKGFPECEKEWRGALRLRSGRLLSVEGCFTWPGQRIERMSEKECSWRLRTHNVGPGAPWASIYGPHVPFLGSPGNQAIIFEMEMARNDKARIELDEMSIPLEPDELLRGSRVIALTDEARREVRQTFHIDPAEVENPDTFFHNAWKVLLHQAAPQEAYEVRHTFRDSPPPGEHYYYLRISQLNGQMAWSSPIWVRCK